VAAIVLIRHGPTEHNANRVFIGQLDVPLANDWSDRTLFQRKVPSVSRVISSPLQRCVETAKSLYPEVAYSLDARLMERSLGEWEGKPKARMRHMFPKAFAPTGEMMPEFVPPGAERVEVFLTRVAGFVASIANETQAIALITHNGVIRAMYHLLLGVGIPDAWRLVFPHLHAVIVERRDGNWRAQEVPAK
jgi:alpha-ribazole phosphatase